MATKLRGLRIKECSLVDVPANPGARIALFKRSDDDGVEGMDHGAQSSSNIEPMPPLKKPKKPVMKDEAEGLLERLKHYLGLDEESEAHVELTEKAAEGGDNQPGGRKMADQNADLAKVLGELQEVKKSVETLTKERDDSRKEVETLKADIKKRDEKPLTPEDMLKALPTEVRARIEKAEKDAKEAGERLTKIEEDRATEVFIGKAQAFKGIIEPATFGIVMRKIAKVDAALYDEVEKALTKASAQIEAARKQSRAFDELGRSGGGDGTSAVEKVDALARDLMAKDSKLTTEGARAQIWKSNQDLARQYAEERRVRH